MQRSEFFRLLIRVLRRKECSIEEITLLLRDPRSKQMAQAVLTLESRLKILNNLVDPTVEVLDARTRELIRSSSPDYYAQLYRQYLGSVYEKIVQAARQMVASAGEITRIILETDPVIEEATNLACNVGKQYRIVVDETMKLNTVLSRVQSASSSGEITEALSQMQKTRRDLEIVVANQFVDPLEAVLKEEARRNSLEMLGLIVYGRK